MKISMPRVLTILLVLTTSAKEAVCIVPVANLTGSYPSRTNKTCDDLLNGPSSQIDRINQLIFNERVTIVAERDNAYRICVPEHRYGTHTDTILHDEYWVAKDAIAPLDTIKNIQAIVSTHKANKTVTLVKPLHDRNNNRHYSFGTRFVLDSIQDKAQHLRVLYITPKLTTEHIYIPKEYCTNTSTLTIPEKIDLFIKLLTDIAEQPGGYVPYVWGGNSFIKSYKNGSVTWHKTTGECTAQPPTKNNPHSGFDCASLVHRAAQAAGIPLHAKNSSGIKNVLKPLAINETIENGDILYIPGHIIALVNIETGMCVEARTQNHGYGYVHHISLPELFKELPNSKALVRYHHSKKLVSRLDSTGNVLKNAPITILKIRSAFEKER